MNVVLGAGGSRETGDQGDPPPSRGTPYQAERSEEEKVGLELDDAQGKNDGVVRGYRYFCCPPNHGLFVRPAVLMPIARTPCESSSRSTEPCSTSAPVSSARRKVKRSASSRRARSKSRKRDGAGAEGGADGIPIGDGEHSESAQVKDFCAKVEVAVQTDNVNLQDLRLMVPEKVVEVETDERRQIIKYIPIERVVTVEKRVPFVKEVVRTVPVDRIVEKIVEVPVEGFGEKIVEVIKEVPVEKVVVKEVVKEVPVERIVEKIVEVEKEVIKEVPVEKIVEKVVIKEVPVDKGGEKEVVKEVIKEVPVERIVEKIVEVEKEVIKEVPVEKIVEKEVTKFVPVDKTLEKEVIKEVIKEVPVERIVEKIVEVEKEVIKEVPIEKIVEKEVIKEVAVEKNVEKIVEVEVIKEVPVQIANEVMNEMITDFAEMEPFEEEVEDAQLPEEVHQAVLEAQEILGSGLEDLESFEEQIVQRLRTETVDHERKRSVIREMVMEALTAWLKNATPETKKALMTWGQAPVGSLPAAAHRLPLPNIVRTVRTVLSGGVILGGATRPEVPKSESGKALKRCALDEQWDPTTLAPKLYHLTLQRSSAITHAIYGNFSAPKAQEIVCARYKTLELLRPDDSGKVQSILSIEIFGVIRALNPFRLTGASRDYIVVASDSGRIVILEYDGTKNMFEKVHQETFGKTGCRRIVPGQYLAVDPKGRAVMIGAIEKQKFVYILNRDSAARLTISSPLEAHKSYTLVYAMVGMDVGFENPLFASIELSYEEVDKDPHAEPPQKMLTLYEMDLGLNHVTRKFADAVDHSAHALIAVPGGVDGPSGVLVCCENCLVYKKQGHPDVVCAIPRRLEMAQEK
ncbi:unnamed protein product, partial [Cladocopium goreaui]